MIQKKPREFKKDLRSFFLSTRNKLSAREVLQKSSQIINQLTDLAQFRKAKGIHTYVSMSSRNEVHTHSLIQKCLNTGIKVSVPKMEPEGKLSQSLVSSFNDLKPNKWGVLETETDSSYDSLDMDLIIVPMVAGDRLKNRLGYGMGYYDRFLNGTAAVKIGLLFDCQMYQKTLPTEEFDIPLDILITESEILY